MYIHSLPLSSQYINEVFGLSQSHSQTVHENSTLVHYNVVCMLLTRVLVSENARGNSIARVLVMARVIVDWSMQALVSVEKKNEVSAVIDKLNTLFRTTE